MIGCSTENKKIGLCESCEKNINIWEYPFFGDWKSYKIKKSFYSKTVAYKCDGYKIKRTDNKNENKKSKL